MPNVKRHGAVHKMATIQVGRNPGAPRGSPATPPASTVTPSSPVASETARIAAPGRARGGTIARAGKVCGSGKSVYRFRKRERRMARPARRASPDFALLPLIHDPLFYAVAIPAVILLGLSKGGFAGVGTAATPLVALYLPPLEAAALILPVLITQDMISLYVYRRDWDPTNLKIMLPGAIAGMAVAWLMAAYVSDATVRIIVGLVGIAFVVNVWLNRKIDQPKPVSAASGVFWGGVSGFTSFMMQGGGPPFQVHVLPQRLPKLTLVGTTTIFFAVINALKIGPYLALGQFNAANFTTSLALLPAAAAANVAGVWLVRKTPTGLFYQIAYVMLFVISVVLLWQGARDLLPL